MPRVTLLLSMIVLIACGDDATAMDAGTSDASADAAPSDGGADSGLDGGSNDAGADAGPAASSRAAFCASESSRLREGSGEIISVSPAGDGQVTVGGSTTTLRAVVSNASEGDIIELADGTYLLADAGESGYTGLYFTTPNVTLRSASGDAAAVIIDSNYRRHGGGSAVVTVAASGVVIADLTVTRSIYHLIHFWSDGDEGLVHNVRLIDGGQQFIKSSGDDIRGVTVQCSSFELTDSGRANVWGYGSVGGSTACYTGGIDTHDSADWTVTDNDFVGIYCDDTPHPQHGYAERSDYGVGLAEHAVHMWDSPSGSEGHLVARNRIVDCARGVGFGLTSEVYGGRIENNMIVSHFPGGGGHDIAISVERGHGVSVAHNTVLGTDPSAYSNSIEYRYDSSENLVIEGNLVSHTIRARNSASATLTDNAETLSADDVVDADTGDLHLSSCGDASRTSATSLTLDFDHESRAASTPLGADECD